MAYLSFTPEYAKGDIVTIASVTSWEHLAVIYDSLAVGDVPNTVSDAEDYVVRGQASLRVKGFLDGQERQMDMFRWAKCHSRSLTPACDQQPPGCSGDVLHGASVRPWDAFCRMYPSVPISCCGCSYQGHVGMTVSSARPQIDLWGGYQAGMLDDEFAADMGCCGMYLVTRSDVAMLAC